MKGWALALAALLPCLWSSAGASAQETTPAPLPDGPTLAFHLPLQIAHGPLDDDRQGWAWTFDARIMPGFSFGVFELSAIGAWAYTNPRNDALLGAQTSVELASVFSKVVGFRLAAETTYMLRAKDARLAGGFLVDLASVFRLGFFFGRDLAQQGNYGMISIASDILLWTDPVAGLVKKSPMEDFRDDP